MTTTSTTTEAPALVPVPKGALACAMCGAAITAVEPETVETARVAGGADGRYTRFASPTAAQLARNGGTIEFARCGGCSEITEQAAELVKQHPAVARLNGARQAQRWTTDALAALEVLNTGWKVTGDTALRLLIRRLGATGGATSWRSRFSPFISMNADPNTCAETRWSHILPEAREVLRREYAGLLYERVTGQNAGRHPEGAGCLICGISTSTSWTPHRAGPQALGRRRSVERIEGYTCTECEQVVALTGSVGLMTMERAVMEHLGIERSRSVTGINGLVGWAAMPKGTPPSAERFGHLDLSSVREDVLTG